MKKWLFFGFIVLCVAYAWVTPIYTTSPDMADFVSWLEESIRYNVKVTAVIRST